MFLWQPAESHVITCIHCLVCCTTCPGFIQSLLLCETYGTDIAGINRLWCLVAFFHASCSVLLLPETGTRKYRKYSRIRCALCTNCHNWLFSCPPDFSLPSGCWSTAPHAAVLTLMRKHYYCVYLYMLCRLMYWCMHWSGWGCYFISVLRYKVKKYSEKVTKYKKKCFAGKVFE